MDDIQLLLKSAEARDGEQLQKALSVFFDEHPPAAIVPILCSVLLEDWHEEHEDIAIILQASRDPQAVDALSEAAKIHFAHLLKWNNLHEFQRKCTWAIADIGSNHAKDALVELASSKEESLSAYARERLQNWQAEQHRKGQVHWGA